MPEAGCWELKMKKLIALAVLLVLAAAGCAGRADRVGREVMLDQFLQGQAADREGAQAKAYDLLKPAAEAGNPNAQYLLATMYDFGRGMIVNHEEANVWYLKAAEQDQDDAQYNLAISYRRGEGIEQDELKAIYWLGRSAARGDQDALAVLTDYAQDGSPEAQYALALVYRDGAKLHNNPELYPDEDDDANIEPDAGKYTYWLNKAAESGSPEAIRESGAQPVK
jgi:TPR repeat protein